MAVKKTITVSKKEKAIVKPIAIEKDYLSHERIQTAEGWKRSQMKLRSPKGASKR